MRTFIVFLLLAGNCQGAVYQIASIFSTNETLLTGAPSGHGHTGRVTLWSNS